MVTYPLKMVIFPLNIVIFHRFFVNVYQRVSWKWWFHWEDHLEILHVPAMFDDTGRVCISPSISNADAHEKMFDITIQWWMEGAIWSYGFSYSLLNGELRSYQEFPNHILVISNVMDNPLWMQVYLEKPSINMPLSIADCGFTGGCHKLSRHFGKYGNFTGGKFKLLNLGWWTWPIFRLFHGRSGMHKLTPWGLFSIYSWLKNTKGNWNKTTVKDTKEDITSIDAKRLPAVSIWISATGWCPPSYKLVYKPHELVCYICHKP